jgi:hypothetical protein
MKFKLKKNIILIGLLLGIIFFCALNDCTVLEGLDNKKDDGSDDEDDKEDDDDNKKEDKGTLGYLEGAVKGAAKGAGKLVKTVNETGKVFESAKTGETLDELEARENDSSVSNK